MTIWFNVAIPEDQCIAFQSVLSAITLDVGMKVWYKDTKRSNIYIKGKLVITMACADTRLYHLYPVLSSAPLPYMVVIHKPLENGHQKED